MKKIYFLVAGCLLFGCASVDKNIRAVHPGEYGGPEYLDGRIFSIACDGNEKADVLFVDDKCKEYISEFAYQKGYSLFTVLEQDTQEKNSVRTYTVNKPVSTESESSVHDGERSVHGYNTTTTYIPKTESYTVTQYTKTYLFVLIDKSEKKKYKNYYKVSDYYTPDAK